MAEVNNVAWSVFKAFLDSRGVSAQFLDTDGHYYLFAYDGPFSMSCIIEQTDPIGDDQLDFETNYHSEGNQSPVGNVRTMLEQRQYLLQMSHVSASSVSGGTSATIDLRVPGEFNGVLPPSNGRYIEEGIAWFFPGGDGDTVQQILVVDKDNIFGQGSDYVAGTYFDTAVDPANQGWALHPIYPLEVETLGWYGFLPSGLYLRLVVSRAEGAPPANFYCNLKWGIQSL